MGHQDQGYRKVNASLSSAKHPGKWEVTWFRCTDDLWTVTQLGGSLWSQFKNVHRITLNLPDSSTICSTAGEAKPLQQPHVNTLLLLPINSPPAAREQLRPRSTYIHMHISVCGHTDRCWNSLLNHVQPRFSLPATSGALSFPLLSVSCREQTFNWNSLLQNNKRKSMH